MKNNFITAVKLIIADRAVAVWLAVFLLGCLAYCIYVAASLHPNDLQVAVHYTAFGGTNFYREKWYYLLSFIVFGITFAAIHTGIVMKLYTQQRRQIALVFISLSFFMLLMAWIVTWSVLRIAAF